MVRPRRFSWFPLAFIGAFVHPALAQDQLAQDQLAQDQLAQDQLAQDQPEAESQTTSTDEPESEPAPDSEPAPESEPDSDSAPAADSYRSPEADAAPATDSEPESTDEEFRIPPPPPGFDFKRPLSQEDFERKNRGGYVTGLPLANFDPNTGAGFGARAYYYYNGHDDDPLFGYTPYLHRVFLQGFATTKGLQFHWLDWDAPAIFGSPYRIRSQSFWYRNISEHYYGLGTAAMGPLTFTGAGRDYGTFEEYNSDLRAVRPDGTTLSRYNHVDLTRPMSLLSIERTFFNGLLRPLVGIAISHATIRDYTGREVSADDEDGEETEAVMGTSKYLEDCAELVGCEGGWDNYFRLGLSFDTRDFEPDPNSGAFIDASLDLATVALGSEYDYARFLFAARYFWSPMPKVTDLVLAGRGTFMVQTPGTPWFSQKTLPWTEDVRTGLGGLRTIRGYQQDRFVGKVVTLTNFEARWNFVQFRALRQQWGLFLVPFLDMGRVYDNARELSFKNWARAQGAGFRVSWNMATIISADYGFSDEDSGLYINFNHQF